MRQNKYKQLTLVDDIERLRKETIVVDTTEEQGVVDYNQRMLDNSTAIYSQEIQALEAKLIAKKAERDQKEAYWKGQLTYSVKKLNDKLSVHNTKIQDKERKLKELREERLDIKNTSRVNSDSAPLTKEEVDAVLSGKDILPPDPAIEKLAFYKDLRAKYDRGDIEYKDVCKVVVKKYGEEEDFDDYCEKNNLVVYN